MARASARSAGGAARASRCCTRTTAFGYFPHNLVGLNERLTDHLAAPPAELPRERQWQVRAREVVLATGAIERPLVFPGNDRPGIMLAGAARTYAEPLRRAAGLARVVLVTACDEAYRAALELHAGRRVHRLHRGYARASATARCGAAARARDSRC